MPPSATATATATTNVHQKQKQEEQEQQYKARVEALYRKQVPVNHDLILPQNTPILHPLLQLLKPLLSKLLIDEREYIQLENIINMSVINFGAIALFWLYPSHLAGLALTLFRILYFAETFMLTMHVGAHTKLFRPEFEVLNGYLETVMAVTMGMPPGCYHIHHVMMHHSENNVCPGDVSSTMPYQRNHWSGLGQYIAKYFYHATWYVLGYAFRKEKTQRAFFYLASMVAYVAAAVYLWVYSGYALQVLWLWPVSFTVLGFAIMHGNFTQHMLVCPDDPFNNHKLSFNCVNHRMNQLTYNDGYHIIHHMNSRMHWADMPVWFEANLEKFAQNDALVFNEICNMDVFVLIITNDYKGLFKHWVQLQPDNIRTAEQFEALCRKRFTPISEAQVVAMRQQKKKEKSI